MSISEMKATKDRGVGMDMLEHKIEERMEWVMRGVYERETIVGVTQRIHGPLQRIARLESSFYDEIKRLPIRS